MSFENKVAGVSVRKGFDGTVIIHVQPQKKGRISKLQFRALYARVMREGTGQKRYFLELVGWRLISKCKGRLLHPTNRVYLKEKEIQWIADTIRRIETDEKGLQKQALAFLGSE